MDEAKRRRFWRRVDRLSMEECWLWTKLDGTPTIGHQKLYSGDGATRSWDYAHRLSYEMHHGPIPTGMVVRHSCDVPSCVNPYHLFIGTYRDNVHDALTRSRGFGRKKLRRSDADVIRAERATGLTNRALAEIHGLSECQVAKITSGRSWR